MKAPSRPNTEPKIAGTRKTKAEADQEVSYSLSSFSLVFYDLRSQTVPKRPPSRARVTPIPEVIAETRAVRSEPTKARSRAATKSTPSSGENAASAPAKTTRAVRKGTRIAASGPRDASGRTTPSEPVQTVDEDDDDPLDSIGQIEDAPMLKKRTRRAAVPKVKQEEVETSAAAVAAGSAGRKRAPTPSTSKPAAPAPTTRGKVAAATRKRAPSTVAAKSLPESGSESGIDKENTPSREDDDTSGQDTAPKTTRVKRSATVTKTKDVEKDDAVKPRTTRATRSRT